MTTYYVTKWALSRGIFKFEDMELDADGDFISRDHTHRNGSVFILGSENFHLTEEAAQARVRSMAEAKLRSLEKTVQKMKKLEKNGTKVVAEKPDPSWPR